MPTPEEGPAHDIGPSHSRATAQPPVPRRIGAAIGCIVLYVVLDLGLRVLALPGSRIIPWYPGAGLAFAALLLVGPTAALPLFAARLVLVFWPPSYPAPVLGRIGDAALLVLAYLAGTMLVRRRVSTGASSWSVREATWLSAGVLAVSLGGGLVGALGPSLWRGEPWSAFLRNALTFAAGDATGALVVVPFILLVLVPGRHRPAGSVATGVGWRRWVERAAQALAVVVAIAVAATTGRHGEVGLGFLCFVPLVAVALREGARGAALVVAAYGLAWIALALATSQTPAQVAMLQELLAVLALTGLFVGATRADASESDARYWHLLAMANEGVWHVDLAGRTRYANTRMLDIMGIGADDLAGRAALDFIAPEERESWLAKRQARREGHADVYEATLVRPDGVRRRVLVSASPVRSTTTRQAVGSVALVTDITLWREAEAGRAVAEERQGQAQLLLETVFRTSRDAMILFRADDEMIIDVNEVWCLVTGYRREDVIGARQTSLDIWADPNDGLRLATAIAEQGFVRDFEFGFHRHLPDGTTENGTAVLAAHPASVDGTTYFLVTGRDITEERKSEQQRDQLQRLEELGRLAGGVAHDFNNLLTVILSYARLLRDGALAGEVPDPADADEIARAAERGRDLTSRLLAFSRHQPIEARALDLNRAVQAAAGLIRPILGADVTIEHALEPTLPAIVADVVQLDQVLLNFAVNARDAMPDGGRFRIVTRTVEVTAADAPALLGPDRPPGTYVLMEVCDTGLGMDEATRTRLFEPFFTTKAPGKGTGLGLAVVFGIVRQAGGAIVVRSAPGRGTTFSVYWPAAGTSVENAQESPDTSSRETAEKAETADLEQKASAVSAFSAVSRLLVPSHGDRPSTILLVEDEVAVRAVARRILERDGFRVVEACDGRDGMAQMERLDARGGLPDLVLSDVMMPHSSGRELAERVALRWPGLPVLLMSGHEEPRPDAVSAEASLAVADIVPKPFTPAALVAAVRTVLAARRDADRG